MLNIYNPEEDPVIPFEKLFQGFNREVVNGYIITPYFVNVINETIQKYQTYPFPEDYFIIMERYNYFFESKIAYDLASLAVWYCQEKINHDFFFFLEEVKNEVKVLKAIVPFVNF